MSDSVKRVVICILLILSLNFSYCEAGYTNKLIRSYTHSIQQEMNTQKKFYKDEYKRKEENPNYKIRDYKEVQRKKAIDKANKQREYIKKIGYWEWVGSELFGKWTLYGPKIKKTLQQIEQMFNAECEHYRMLNPLHNGFVPYNHIIPMGM